MYLAAGHSRPIRSLFRDVYEGGFQMPVNASAVRVTIDPPDLATVVGETITWARAGSGTIRGEVTQADGSVRAAEGTVSLECGQLPPVPEPVTKQPALLQTVLVDPDA